jgi:hypothetical protein
MRWKVCKQCGEEKSIRCFYRHPSYADGRLRVCKVCHKANVAENRELKYEYYRAAKRAWSARPENVAKRRAYAKSPRGRKVHDGCNRRWRRFQRFAVEQRV